MWDLLSQDAIPPTVAGDLIDSFNARYKESDDFASHVEELISDARPPCEETRLAVQAVQAAALLGRSQIAKDVRRIEEEHLYTMFDAIARAGLKRWASDVIGPPRSSYNSLHKHIAISTFKLIATSFGYTHMKVNTANLRDFPFLYKLYDNFVYGYMTEIARKEGVVAGRVGQNIARENARRRRDAVGLILYSNTVCFLTAL